MKTIIILMITALMSGCIYLEKENPYPNAPEPPTQEEL